MKKRRLNVMQLVGIALATGGTVILILSVDPYMENLLTTEAFLQRATWCVMCMIGGWMCFRRKVESRWHTIGRVNGAARISTRRKRASVGKTA